MCHDSLVTLTCGFMPNGFAHLSHLIRNHSIAVVVIVLRFDRIRSSSLLCYLPIEDVMRHTMAKTPSVKKFRSPRHLFLPFLHNLVDQTWVVGEIPQISMNVKLRASS
jgi:hypothetical protein